MDTPQHPMPVQAPESPRIIKAFVCYRRDDASFAAQRLHELLDKHVFVDRDGESCQLDVYFDQAEPGVENWKSHHQPSLETARAFIVLCSHGLAADFSKAGSIDWAHREIGWWVDNRSAAPVVVDLTENERWVPDRIRKRWPDLNRLLVDATELRRNAPISNNELALRQRIVETILESERATTFDELTRTRKKNTQLKLVSAFAVAACVAASLLWWRAERAQKVAETQREVARHTVGFLTSLFAGADPDSSFGENLTVKQILKAGPATVRKETSPLLKANVLRAMGSAYTGLGDTEAALDSLTQAEKILEHVPIEGEDRFRMEYSLAEAYLYAEEYDAALEHIKRAQDLAGSAGVDKSERASVVLLLGDYFAWSTDPQRDEARLHYEAALALDQKDEADWLAVARDYNRLGNLALDEEKQADARTFFQKAIDTLKEKLPAGAKDLFVAQYEHDYAALLFNDGKLQDALDRYSMSSTSFKSAYGDRSVEFGIAENNAARILLELDRLEEAATRATTAIEVETEAAGRTFSGLAFSHNTLALTLRAAGQMPKAKAEFSLALEVAKAHDMPFAGSPLVHLAEMELSDNKISEARKLLASADEQFQKHKAASGWRYALYENALGELRTRDLKFDEGCQLLERSAKELNGRWPNSNIFTRKAAARQQALDVALQRAPPCSQRLVAQTAVGKEAH